mmetsp:Transcript_26981/g.23870  ORF Transcript_26981/g.23870 Transcript_26981/m.23870 type:complete len:97 (+) Transcript_26981:1376-1666(+)
MHKIESLREPEEGKFDITYRCDGETVWNYVQNERTLLPIINPNLAKDDENLVYFNKDGSQVHVLVKNDGFRRTSYWVKNSTYIGTIDIYQSSLVSV